MASIRKLMLIGQVISVLCCIFAPLRLFAIVKAEETYGYVSDVDAERKQKFFNFEIKTVSFASTQQWNNKIFNEPLSKEFKEKYREKFGQLDSESIHYKPANFEILDRYKPLSTITETQTAQRRSFADYMVKRLTEYHVDNYIKSEPEMRPIYETKERLSKIEVEVTKETKINAQYSLSSNVLDLLIDNPYCDSKVSMELDNSETRVTIGKTITRQWIVQTNTLTRDGIAQIDFIRPITPRFVTVWGGSTYFKEEGTSVRENRLTAGMNFIF